MNSTVESDWLEGMGFNSIVEYKQLISEDKEIIENEIKVSVAAGWEVQSKAVDILRGHITTMKRLISVEHCYVIKKITSFCQEELCNDVDLEIKNGWEVVKKVPLSATLKKKQPNNMILRARTQESLKNLEEKYVADGWILSDGPMLNDGYWARFIHKLDPGAVDVALTQIKEHYDAELHRDKTSPPKRETITRHTCPSCNSKFDVVIRKIEN